MAYAASISIVEVPVARPGRVAYAVTVTETEAQTTSQWASDGSATGNTLATPGVVLPKSFRIVSRKVNITAGTATQVAPVLAKATGITAAGVNSISVDAAAAAVNDVTAIPAYVPDSVLYGRSQTQGVSTNNSVTTEILIVAGWEA